MLLCISLLRTQETQGEQKNTLSRRGTSLGIPIVLDCNARRFQTETTVKND